MKIQHKVLLLAFLGGLFFWIVDSGLDYAYSSGRTFVEILLYDQVDHELYTRIFFFFAFIIFGVLASRLTGRLKRVEDERENFIMAVANSSNGIALTDESDRYVFVNEAYANLHGYAQKELIGKTCLDLIPPEMVPQSRQVLDSVLRDPASGIFNSEITAMRKDGSQVPIEIRAKSFWDNEGNYQGHTCIVHDISEERETKEALEQNARFLTTIFESIRDPFMILDRDFRIVKANQAYAEMKHMKIEELTGRTCYVLTRNGTGVCDGCIVAKTFRSGDPSAKEKQVTSSYGTEEWVEIFTYPISDREGVITHVVEYVRDITDRKRAERESHRFIKKLETLSSEDSLTGLLNRRMIFDRLRHEVDRARRYGAPLSLIFCDLDSFKEINDTHGHYAGDEMLKATADILRNSIRLADVVGRYGGDEFLLVLPQTTLKGAQELAERIRSAMEHMTVDLPGGGKTGTTMSLGVVCHNGTEIDLDALIGRIDAALYASKRSGKNRVHSLT